MLLGGSWMFLLSVASENRSALTRNGISRFVLFFNYMFA